MTKKKVAAAKKPLTKAQARQALIADISASLEEHGPVLWPGVDPAVWPAAAAGAQSAIALAVLIGRR